MLVHDLINLIDEPGIELSDPIYLMLSLPSGNPSQLNNNELFIQLDTGRRPFQTVHLTAMKLIGSEPSLLGH